MDWNVKRVLDPFRLKELLWPHVKFYKQQRMVIESVMNNDETFVPAGNMLGKDFVAGFIALWFFLSRTPCRVITTSADHNQLEGVLWGEIRRFIQTSRVDLDYKKGGPLVITHLKLRKFIDGKRCPLSYCEGRVAAKGEGMLGHHIPRTGDGIPRTLMIGDEASGVEDINYERGGTWAARKLFIGNPYTGPVGCSFFEKYSEEGDVLNPTGGGYYRKVIRITAEDSPNVQYARAQEAARVPITDEMVIEGVLPWDEYQKRRLTWDEIRQSIGLDARFYKGAGVMMYPMAWLDRAEARARELVGLKRKALSMGIDSGQGSSETSISVCDELGLITQINEKTPDTAAIPKAVKRIGHMFDIPPSKWMFDAGGGGVQHADTLRAEGFPVPPAVGFGEAVQVKTKRKKTPSEKDSDKEQKYQFGNRRAEMYWMLRECVDPSLGNSFGLPAEFIELRKQLGLMPIIYDGEGRICMLPKYRKSSRLQTVKTLTEIIGKSPDESDSLVLAVYGMKSKTGRKKVRGLKRR